MRGITRLTPIVPGEMQPVVWLDGSIKTGFIGGECAEGRGFPQWAHKIFAGDKVHWFLGDLDRARFRRSLCGRVNAADRHLHMPGNWPRCKACEKALEVQRRHGVRA